MTARRSSNLMVTADEAMAERAARVLARRRLIAYSEYLLPWYRSGRHHRLVGDHLEQVKTYIETKGKEGVGRLMIFEPFRHGKTEQVSRIFPSWLLGSLPNSRVIVTSYGADLAQEDSRAIRNYVMSERYKNVFGSRAAVDAPVELSEDSRARANWNLAEPHRGGVVSAGVGGGIVGKGAHLLVIDDPFKNREEASSEAHRRKVMGWYRGSAYTRLEDGGAIVITHTRWDPEDLAGQLLMEMVNDPIFADQWTVLFLPAVALEADQYPKSDGEITENLLRGIYIPRKDPLERAPGEPLWPEKYTKEALAKIQANIGDFEWTAQAQQLPRPLTGGFFNESDFGIADYVPGGLQWYVYVDLALGKTQASDFNAAGATALDPATGKIYLRDVLVVRELTEFLIRLAEWMVEPGEKGTIWGIEDVQFQSLVMREFLRDARLANVAIQPVSPQGDKVQRARPIQTRGRMGALWLKRGTWNQAFIREALMFPHGRHDDQVDMLSGGLQMIAETSGDEKAASTTGRVVMAESLFM